MLRKCSHGHFFRQSDCSACNQLDGEEAEARMERMGYLSKYFAGCELLPIVSVDRLLSIPVPWLDAVAPGQPALLPGYPSNEEAPGMVVFTYRRFQPQSREVRMAWMLIDHMRDLSETALFGDHCLIHLGQAMEDMLYATNEYTPEEMLMCQAALVQDGLLSVPIDGRAKLIAFELDSDGRLLVPVEHVCPHLKNSGYIGFRGPKNKIICATCANIN